MNLKEFAGALPKTELHLHIEGSLEPELMFALAQRNKVSIPFDSVAEIRAAYKFSNLQSFLDIYYQGMAVLKTEQDFHDLTYAYLERAAADNARHTEIFFDPQGHTERGVEFKTVIKGIRSGLQAGRDAFGISSKLIMCFLRHLSERDAFVTFEQAQPFLDHIDGVGLDSSEVGNPPSKFRNVFREAKKLGLKCVAHAGEEGPPEYIWEALDELCVDRIDHGNAAQFDGGLIKRLSDDQTALTMCPLSNLKLCVLDDLNEHPIRMLMASNVCVTVNSDDPSYFGGYVSENYQAIIKPLNLSKDELVTLAKNSVIGSFADASRQNEILDEIDAFARASIVDKAH